MRYYFHYIRHFLSSHSTHGTHSPFVYALADQAIYQHMDVAAVRGIELVSAAYRPLVLRLLSYLGKTSIVDLHAADAGFGDVLLLSAAELDKCTVEKYLSHGFIILVEDLYISKGNKKSWEGIVKRPEVTVSIDLFHVGLLIKRQGQFKEYFKLRYPYWIK